MAERFEYQGRAYESIDELLSVLKADGIDVKRNRWTTVSYQIMEDYTADDFIEKARDFLDKNPPDIVQTSEKIWFAAVYAVKNLYLNSGGIDLKSQNSLRDFCNFAIEKSELPLGRRQFLRNTWFSAEKMHQDVYRSDNFNIGDYPQIITDVESFVEEVGKFDHQKLWIQFQNEYIRKTDPAVKVHQVNARIKLGGFDYQCNYNVYV